MTVDIAKSTKLKYEKRNYKSDRPNEINKWARAHTAMYRAATESIFISTLYSLIQNSKEKKPRTHSSKSFTSKR